MYSRDLSEKLHPRERRQLDPTRPIVGDDFVTREEPVAGSVIAPRTIGYTRKVLWGLLTLSIVFFIAAFSFFVYYFTLGGGSGSASAKNIDITISGPAQVAGGDSTKLQIVLTNRNKVPLELADLVITYPEGTRTPADFKTDFPSQRIPMGTIYPGDSKQGTVTAVFSGESNEHKTVKVELEYHVQGSSAIFVASKTYDIVLNSAPIAISVEGNMQTISGQPVQLTIDVSSNSSAPIRDVLVHVDYPFGFKFTNATPAAVGPNLWAVGDLAPGDHKTIVLGGTMSGESGDNRVFRIQAGTRSSPNASNISTQIAESSFTMEVSQAFLGLSVSANKQTGSSAIAAPGESVTVTVGYQNNLSTVITDAVVVARLTGLEIDGSDVHTNDGFYRSSDNTVLWDKTTTNGALGTLTPGAKGTLQFTFQMPSSEALKNIVNPKLAISINAAGKRVSETGVPQNLQSAARQDIKLTSDLQINAQALYYANPFGSSGPMPPKANTETTYAIVFTVTNTTNTLHKAKLTATLPAYVRWIGTYVPNSEKLTFNSSDGTFTWDLGDIAQNVGVAGNPPRQIAISIGLTPSASQIGQQPILIQNVTLTATDEASGKVVTKKATPDVTTNLLQVGKSSSESVVGTDPGFSPTNATVVK